MIRASKVRLAISETSAPLTKSGPTYTSIARKLKVNKAELMAWLDRNNYTIVFSAEYGQPNRFVRLIRQ